MTNSISIEEVNLRDLSFIIANMRDMDRKEILCQYPYDDDRENLKVLTHGVMAAQSFKHIAKLKGQPVAVFGMQEVSPKRFKGWAFGTDKMKRAVPAITKFIQEKYITHLEQYANRIEAESLVGHEQAHKWLVGLGSTPVLTMKKIGKNGEDFILFERVF